MTQEELEADAIAAEIAAKAEQEELEKAQKEPTLTLDKGETTEMVTPSPEPVKPEPTPVVTTPDADALKATIAENETRIADLTKRLRDEDGRRGGDLFALRTQVDNLGSQLRELMAENRELKAKQTAKPIIPKEPDELETEFPSVASGIARRTQPAIEAAARAEQIANEAKENTAKLMQDQRDRDYNSFMSEIRGKVSRFDEINRDPKFIEWCGQRVPGTPFTRQATLTDCGNTMTAQPVIELFQQWEKENEVKVTKVDDDVTNKGKKPSKEAQVEPPKSSDSTPTATKPKAVGNRIKELEDKIFRFGTATKEDRAELDRLYETTIT